MPSPLRYAPLTRPELLERITQTPGQCGGRPCMRGMRIRVTDILEMLSANVSAAEILLDFPDLQPEDIQACLLFAARRTDFPRACRQNILAHKIMHLI